MAHKDVPQLEEPWQSQESIRADRLVCTSPHQLQKLARRLLKSSRRPGPRQGPVSATAMSKLVWARPSTSSRNQKRIPISRNGRPLGRPFCRGIMLI